MSNDSCESKANLVTLSSENSSTTMASATSGLESIVLALESLQKEPPRTFSSEAATPITTPRTVSVQATLPTTTLTKSPPIPHGINSAKRVVSTDTIGNDDTNSEFPQVKEEGALCSSDKASDTTPCSATVESTRPTNPSSPLPSPPQSEPPTDDIPSSTDYTSKASDFSQILADPKGWLLQTENLFAKLPPVDRSSENDIVVQPNDVLCGRGGETNHHPGNIRYRSLVKAYQKLYLLAKRRDKPKIAQCIVVSVRGVDGRFLKRTKNSNKGSAWVDVGNVKAREKTSQALREGAPNLRDTGSPPVTTGASTDNTAASAIQVLVPKAESMTAPPTATTTLPTGTPTALEAMMGWRLPGATFNGTSSTTNAKGSNPSLPPGSSSPSDADNEAYLQVFTKAATQLMHHPAFHQLDQARQQEAILFELKNAKAAVESAKRSSPSTGTTTPANIHEQERTSPMIPTASINQQQPPQPQQRQQYPAQFYHHVPRHYYSQMHGNYWQDGNSSNPKNPSSMDAKSGQARPLVGGKIATSQVDKNVDLQKMYRELLVAKAAAASGSNSGFAFVSKNGDKPVPTEEQRRKMKKRPASSSSSSVHVVSDTGSEVSSSSSCASLIVNNCEPLSASSCNAIASSSRGGSRLKRLKLRMKDDFK